MPAKTAPRTLPIDEVIAVSLLGLSPCAIVFYLWMLTLDNSRGYREVFFSDFAEYLKTKINSKEFGDRWLRNSMRDLQELGLITIVKRHGAGVFWLKVNRLGQPPC